MSLNVHRTMSVSQWKSIKLAKQLSVALSIVFRVIAVSLFVMVR